MATVARLTAALESLDEDLHAASYPRRFGFIEPVVRETHDLQVMAGLVLGRNVDTLDDAQRREFAELFAELTVANYATRFRDLGAGFDRRSDAPARGGRHTVEVWLSSADGPPVRLDYLVQERAGRWRIVNVLAEGVSDLALKRGQYGAIITSQGFGGLRAALRAEIDALAADQAMPAR